MRDVPRELMLRRLAAENPWWDEAAKIPPPFQKWQPRPYLDLFGPVVEDRSVRRVVVLMGPRRVGKTVRLHHTIAGLLARGVPPKRIGYVSVDHPLYTGLDPEEIIRLYHEATGVDTEREPCYLFLDEIQYLKNWEAYLKSLVDRHSELRLTVSGSAAAALRLKSRESGAGRFTDFLLPPLSFYEFLRLLERDDLIELDTNAKSLPRTDDIQAVNELFLQYLNHGGYPEAIFSPTIQRDPVRYIKSDIIDKVLLRDLPSLYGIDDIQELNYLFTTLAFNTANEVSLDGLSKNSGVSKNTIRRYLEYLEAAFLIRIVHRVDKSAKRFKRANFFKVYLTNPSIRSALFAPIEEPAEDTSFGSLVETAIFAQWFHRPARLHYARWRTGEVDLVKLDERHLRVDWALEAKWSDRFPKHPGELKSLLQFCHTNNLDHAWVTTQTLSDRITHENVRLGFIPASLYCYAAGFWGIRERFGP